MTSHVNHLMGFRDAGADAGRAVALPVAPAPPRRIGPNEAAYSDLAFAAVVDPGAGTGGRPEDEPPPRALGHAPEASLPRGAAVAGCAGDESFAAAAVAGLPPPFPPPLPATDLALVAPAEPLAASPPRLRRAFFARFSLPLSRSTARRSGPKKANHCLAAGSRPTSVNAYCQFGSPKCATITRKYSEKDPARTCHRVARS